MNKYKILLTGATGLIGSALVKKLVRARACLTCPLRNIEKVKTMFCDDIINEVNWVDTPVEDYLEHLNDSFDYIIHGASPTASRFFTENQLKQYCLILLQQRHYWSMHDIIQ